MATTTKQASESEVSDALKNEIAALRSDLSELGGMVARIGKDRAGGLRSAAETTVQEGVAKGEAVFGDVVAELRKVEQDVVDSARAKPLQAIGIGLLVGLLLGLLVRR